MTVFVDSGVAYAQRHEPASRHDEASAATGRVLAGEFGRPTASDYVVNEAFTLARSRAGLYEAGRDVLAWYLGLGGNQAVFKVLEVDQAVFQAAIDVLDRFRDHDLSFTDATTVALVEDHGIDHVLSFDDDFDGVLDRIDPADLAG